MWTWRPFDNSQTQSQEILEKLVYLTAHSFIGKKSHWFRTWLEERGDKSKLLWFIILCLVVIHISIEFVQHVISYYEFIATYTTNLQTDIHLSKIAYGMNKKISTIFPTFIFCSKKKFKYFNTRNANCIPKHLWDIFKLW